MKTFIQVIAPILAFSLIQAMEITKSELDEKVISAAEQFDIPKMRKLLAAGANINARDNRGYSATALHWVIGSKDYSQNNERSLKMAQYLINETKININGTNNQSTTPLVFALCSMRYDIANLLLDREDVDVNIANNSGDTALRYAHLNQDLIPAKKSLEAKILKRGGKKADILSRNLFAREDNGRTSDFMENGHEPYNELRVSLTEESHAAALALAKEILEKRSQYQGWNTFFLAIAQNNLEVVKLLIEAGIQFDRHYERGSGYNVHSESPMDLADYYEHTAIADLLREYKKLIVDLFNNKATVADVSSFKQKGFFINFRSIGSELGMTMYGASARGVTPLHCAIENKNLPIVQALVEAGADVNATDASGATPLNYAAQVQEEDIVSYLLSKDSNLTIALKKCKNQEEREFLLSVAAKITDN